MNLARWVYAASALLFAGHSIARASVQSLPPLPNGGVAAAVRIDAAGSLYVAGTAASHAFVAKLSADASQVIWWTALAGSVSEEASMLALGADGSVYAAGIAQSTDFPTTTGAMQTTGAAGTAFAVKLDPAGAVVYSTYIPVSSLGGLAVDSAGHALLTGGLSQGQTLQATPGTVTGTTASPGTTFNPLSAYIMELDPTGSKQVFTIVGFGGTQVAVDSRDNIYAVGAFNGPQAPTTPGAFQTTAASVYCVANQLFVNYCREQHIAKIDPSGTKLIYATYLSGTWDATPRAMAVDSAGNVIVAGTTSSPDYPTTPDAFQPEYPANPSPHDSPTGIAAPRSVGYVTKLNASGTGLIWSTLLGGSSGTGDSIDALALDANGDIGLVGDTDAGDFPGLWNIPVAARQSPANRPFVVTRLSAGGSAILPVQQTSGAFSSIAMRPDGSAVIAQSQLIDVTFLPPGRVEAICDSADEAEVVSVAPGQLLTLYGSNLAPELGNPSGFPTAFNGVAVTFNGIAAPILYAAGDQINVQVPYEVAGQSQVTMLISSSQVSPAVSESYYLAVVARQPGIFLNPASFGEPLFDLATCNGQSLDGVQPLAFNADGSLNSCATPAAAGSAVTVFLNGIGATVPAQTTGAVSTSAVAIAPPASLNLTPSPRALPTQTVPGLIAAVAAVQVPAPATSSVLYLEIFNSAAQFPVRGPGIVIWVKAP